MKAAAGRPLRLVPLLAVAASAVALLAIGAAKAPVAEAAPCPAPTILNLAGNVSVSGTSPCDTDPENFSVFCGSGDARFDYYVNSAFQGTFDTGTACSAVARLTVQARDGDDLIDLSRVSSANGFTALNLPNVLDGGAGADLIVGAKLPNAVSGGSGDDIALLRNGVSDTADCGPDIDAVQADQAAADVVTSCEIADFLPAATTGAPNLTNPKAKKCKKKQRKKHRCKKRHAAT